MGPGPPRSTMEHTSSGTGSSRTLSRSLTNPRTRASDSDSTGSPLTRWWTMSSSPRILTRGLITIGSRAGLVQTISIRPEARSWDSSMFPPLPKDRTIFRSSRPIRGRTRIRRCFPFSSRTMTWFRRAFRLSALRSSTVRGTSRYRGLPTGSPTSKGIGFSSLTERHG